MVINMMKRNLFLILFAFVLCAISVNAFSLSTYDVGSEWIVLNYTAVNQTLLNDSFPTAVYAEGFFHSYSDPAILELATTDTYYQITNFSMHELKGFNVTPSGVVVLYAGTYKLSFNFAMSGGNSGDYELEFFKNGVGQEDCATFVTTATTDHLTAAINCLIMLEKGDVLMVKAKDLGNPAQDISYHQLNLNIIRIDS